MPAHPLWPQAWQIETHDTLPSTQIRMSEWAEQGAPERSLVWAKAQSNGVGRRGHQWVSPPGNLYVSFLLCPKVTVSRVPELGFVISLAVLRALEEYLPDNKKAALLLKWPNDVLLEGGKIAGLMLECVPHGVIIGLGVNLNQCPTDTPRPATALAAHGASVDVAEFLARLLVCLDNVYALWQTDGFAPIRTAWGTRAAFQPGDRIDIHLPHENFSARLTAWEDNGALRVTLDDGSVRLIHAGDVFFFSPPNCGK